MENTIKSRKVAQYTITGKYQNKDVLIKGKQTKWMQNNQ